jgi:hypothetical protein
MRRLSAGLWILLLVAGSGALAPAALADGRGSRATSRAGARIRAGRQQLKNWGARVRGRLGDRLVHLRGRQRAIDRAGRLQSRGDDRRALVILGRALRSTRLTRRQRVRALSLVGTAQAAQGNHDQSIRAMAGAIHHDPGYRLPRNAPADIRENFKVARGLVAAGAMRGEAFSAELPGEQRLLGRLGQLKVKLQARIHDSVSKHPKLLKAHAMTLGKLNVWRARRALVNRFGIPRFKVTLEADQQNPTSAARANLSGSVSLDYSETTSYDRALATLAHEAYHLNNPVAAWPRYQQTIKRYDRSIEKLNALREAGFEISKATPAGLKQRSVIAGKLWREHRNKRALEDRLFTMVRKEEEAADQFAGYVMGRENRRLGLEANNITSRAPDRYHPSPNKAARMFLRGAREGLADLAGVQLYRPRQQKQ